MSALTSLFTPPQPSVALEISSSAVTALRVSPGTPATVQAHAIEPLPAGAVTPALAGTNIADGAAVSAAVARALERVGGARHAALVLPDSVAKVSLVRFDHVPARPADLDAMLRWQVRKSVPFKVEDAQLAWSEGQALPGGGREFVVALALRRVVEEYETACLAAGADPGLVDLASFNLINLQLASGHDAGDWLLVHLSGAYVTLAVVRAGALIFYRHRGDDGDESVTDLVHQTAMYYEDRLAGTGFSRVLVAGASQGPDGLAGADDIRRSLQERLGIGVEALDLRRAVTLGDRSGASAELLDRLAPLVGILVRERAA